MRTALAPLILLVALVGTPPVAAGVAGTGPATFFPPSSSRIDVVVPADAAPGTVRAGLAAVGALAVRYPTASIGLRPDDDVVPQVAQDQRVVSLLASSGPPRRRVGRVDGVPALLLGGHGLTSTAAALAPPGGRPAVGADVRDPGSTFAVDPGAAGTDRVQAARRAAPLLAAVQQTAERPLTVDLAEPGSLVTGDRSGVLVGATAADAAAVAAPLGLRAASGVPGLAAGTAYAALQPVDDGPRRLLLLGGWAPDDAAGRRLLDRLLDRAAYTAGTTGWDGRGEEALVVTQTQDPLLLPVPDPTDPPTADPPTTDPPTADPPTAADPTDAAQEDVAGRWWFVAGVLALLLALVGRALATLARQRGRATG